MALNFDKCIFEILAKLGAAELTALCKFIDAKVALLRRELDTALAFTNVRQDQFIEIEALLRAGENRFQDLVQSSTLLNVARGLSPACGNLANVFQGALDAADIVKTGVNDAEYVARQILTVDGLINTVKNEALDAISALTDLCGIIQLVLLENAGDFSQFIGPQAKSITALPKG